MLSALPQNEVKITYLNDINPLMEELLSQVRSKFSGREELGNTRYQRTSSFRESKPQKWLRRQFSRQMSNKEPAEDAEYAAAVAAAAFAITSLDSESPDQKAPEAGPQFSLPRIISGIVDRISAAAQPDEALNRNNDDHQARIPEKTIHPVPSIKRIPTMPKKRLTFADELQEDSGMPYNYIEKSPTFDEESEDAKKLKPTIPFTRRSPSVKRTPTFGEEQTQNAKPTKQESSAPRLYPSSNIPPPPAVPPLYIEPIDPPKRAHRARRGSFDTDADAWETEEMAKIKERYEKLNATILEWEDKKKKKARRKLESTEVRFKSKQDSSCYKYRKAFLTKVCLQESQSNKEKRRAKALQNYQIEMERIRQIADGARAQAKEKRRKKELKVKEKANKYRATGEPPLPPMCLCL